MRNLDEAAREFASAVEEAGGHCMFVGGLVVAIWGAPRFTQDVDVLLAIEEKQIPLLVAALHKRGLDTTVFDMVEGRRERSHVTVRESQDLWVDVKFALTQDEVDQVGNAVDVEGVPVSGIEETIAYKILYESDKDRQDVRSIIGVSPVNETKLRGIMERLGLSFRRYQQLKKGVTRVR